MGPFEDEEEGTDIVSDVVKMEGEDPATPGCESEGGQGEDVGDSQRNKMSWLAILIILIGDFKHKGPVLFWSFVL